MTSKQQTILDALKTKFEADSIIYGTGNAKINEVFTDKKPVRLNQNTMQLFFSPPESGEKIGEDSGHLWIKQEISVIMEFKRPFDSNDDIYVIVEQVITDLKADRGLAGEVKNAIAIPIGYDTTENKMVDTAYMNIEVEYDL